MHSHYDQELKTKDKEAFNGMDFLVGGYRIKKLALNTKMKNYFLVQALVSFYYAMIISKQTYII